jgi:sugar lactone lactonase YvrE
MKQLLCFLLILAAACTGHNKSQTTPPADTVRVVLSIKADLGEGAFWNQRENLLWWIDIEKGLLHKYNPVDGTDKEYKMGRRIGTVVPSESGKALVALEDGLNFFDPATGDFSFIADPDAGIPDMRYNDGKCDPSGRLWVGGMGMGRDSRNKASLYRLDHDLKTNKMLDSITCSNGICWSPDKTKMYYIDTPTMKVRVFDYDK